MTLTAHSEAGHRAERSHLQLSANSLPLPVLLYLATVMLPVLFSAGSVALSLQRLLLLLLVIPLTINLISGKYGRILWTDVFFFLHILWAALAIAINNPDRVVQNAGSTSIEFLGGYLVGRAYIRSTDDFIAFSRVFIFIVCCTLPFALYETITGHPVIIELIRKVPGLTSFNVNYQEARMGLERVQTVFAHPIHYGLFCGTAFSLHFVGLKELISPTKRYLASVTIGLCVFLSLSSGALLPLILQLGLIFWAFALNSVRQRWLILLGLFVMAYVTIDLLSNRTPIKVFMTYATFSAHNAYWRSIIFEWGMFNVWANPIVGIGLNDWIRPYYMRSGSMDNFWLVNAVRYGIPGFLLLALGYLPALWTIGRRNFEADLRLSQLRRAWIFTFVGLTLTLCTVHVWTSIYSFVFFLFGAGMWFITAEAKAESDGDGTPQTTTRGPISYSRSFPERAAILRDREAGVKPTLARAALAAKQPQGKPDAPTRKPPPLRRPAKETTVEDDTGRQETASD